MKRAVCWLVSSWFGCREITRSGGFSIFFRGEGRHFSGSYYQIVEVDPIRGGDDLVLLPDSRNRRQLVLLLTLSIEPSLWVHVRQQSTNFDNKEHSSPECECY